MNSLIIFFILECYHFISEYIIFYAVMGDPSLLTTRITYGKETQRNEYPWQVAMFVGGNRFSCGGSIIGDFYILTAAHCVIRYLSIFLFYLEQFSLI